MKNKFLEAGQIVNTHGIQGEVKIVPWCDSPEFLCSFTTLYIDGAPIKVLAARPHKGNVLARLEGVTDVNAAMRLKGKTLSIDRTGVELPDGAANGHGHVHHRPQAGDEQSGEQQSPHLNAAYIPQGEQAFDVGHIPAGDP